MSQDYINNPLHYTKGGIEMIDVINAKLNPMEFQGYMKGTIQAYAGRLGLKGNTVDDLDKIIWYCQCYKKFLIKGDKDE